MKLLCDAIVIIGWSALCLYWRRIGADDDTVVEDDPDVWTGPW